MIQHMSVSLTGYAKMKYFKVIKMQLQNNLDEVKYNNLIQTQFQREKIWNTLQKRQLTSLMKI